MNEQVVHALNNTELLQWYREHGFAGRIGFGERPALLVIDMAKAWLDSTSPLGSESVEAIVPKIVELLQVDTLIITGCSTSGCVRCTAESAINYNLHTIVVKDAVADRSASAHEANLFDIDSRLADVVPFGEVIAYLEKKRR